MDIHFIHSDQHHQSFLDLLKCSVKRRINWAALRENLSWFWSGHRQTELYIHIRWLVSGNFKFRKLRACAIYMAKARPLSKRMTTMQLISTFVSAMPKNLSHDAAQSIFFHIRHYHTILLKNLHIGHNKVNKKILYIKWIYLRNVSIIWCHCFSVDYVMT